MYAKQQRSKDRSAQLRAELFAGKRKAATTPDARVAVDFDHTRAVLAQVPEEQRGEACAYLSQVLTEARRRIADGDFR
jgi:hypothetical protein